MSCTYTVLGVRQTTMNNPLGGYMTAQEVTIQPSKGGVQRILIPASEFTPEKVAEEAKRICTNIDAVYGLNG